MYEPTATPHLAVPLPPQPAAPTPGKTIPDAKGQGGVALAEGPEELWPVSGSGAAAELPYWRLLYEGERERPCEIRFSPRFCWISGGHGRRCRYIRFSSAPTVPAPSEAPGLARSIAPSTRRSAGR